MPKPTADPLTPASFALSPRIWWELTVNVDTAWAEAVGEALRQISAAGLVETGDGFKTYFPDEQAAREAMQVVAKAASGPAVGNLTCDVKPVAETEWDHWRHAFRPVSIGRRLWICPVWDADAAALRDDSLPPADASDAAIEGGLGGSPSGESRLAVIIEPGLAFGTGDHPTTAACLQYLEEIVAEGMRVLDAGTGSGILAIAAALLGAHEVVAVDVDPVACRSAAANVAMNRGASGKVSVLCRDIAELAGSGFDLVVANLTSDAVIRLLPMLVNCLGLEGRLVVSGISIERAGEVRLALDAAGLALVDQVTERGWLTAYLRRGDVS